MRATIRPSRPNGTILAPPSKSMAHRLLLCAGLCDSVSTIHNLAYSDDVNATLDCLRALGAEIQSSGDSVTIHGVDPRNARANHAILPCCECGSTLRFFIPLCLLSGEKTTLSGSETLLHRPLSVYETICRSQGLLFEKRNLELTVQGPLRPGVFEVEGNISSQFISGLLFALPLLSGNSEIRLLSPLQSRPYVDMTIDALRRFGVEIERKDNSFFIKGNQTYRPHDETVEGDFSNAAFFDALALLFSSVSVDGLSPSSLQADRVYPALFEKLKIGEENLDLSDCPDLAPILFALSAALGRGSFIGTKRLKIKESDRILSMQEELSKFGAVFEVEADAVRITCDALTPPKEKLFSHGDHRVVMALSVLCTLVGGEIEGAEHVRKSFPDFFEQLKSLGVDLTLTP